MNLRTYTEFQKFLEWPEDRRIEYLFGFQLHWYQRLYVRLLNRWWSRRRANYPHIRPSILWESIYKGRF